MAGRVVTERICEKLKNLKQETAFKLEYVEAWTESRGHKVSRQTVSRALNGKVANLRDRSAEMLAIFVESMMDGTVSAEDLLAEEYVVGRQFKDETLHDRNFTFYRFENVVFKNMILINVRFDHAHLQDVVFDRATIKRSMFTQSHWENVVVTECCVYGSSFSNVHMQKARWLNTKLIDCVFKRE